MRVPSNNTERTDKPRRVVKLNKETIRVRECKKAMEQVGDSVSAVIESGPEKKVSFAEASGILNNEIGFNLEEARNEAVKMHGRWGLIDALVEKGAIKDESEYADLLGQITIGEKGLIQACELIKDKARVLAVFDPGTLMPDELVEAIFTVKQAGSPDLPLCYIDTYAFQNINNIRKISPEHLPDLTKLMKMPDERQMEAFKEAYKKGESLKPTGPRLFFTHDCQNVTYTKKSVVENIRSSARGEMQFLDPIAGFLAARQRVDIGMRAILKLLGRGHEYVRMNDNFYRSFLVKFLRDRTIVDHMPDNKKTVRYPGYALESGCVPALNFHSNNRMFSLNESSPYVSDAKVGSRLMYG